MNPTTASNLFAELIRPLPPAQFLALLRQRKLTLLRANPEVSSAPLLDWNELRSLIESGRYPLEKLCIQCESTRIPAVFYAESGKTSMPKLDELLRKGVSIIMEPIDQQVPLLAALCQDIRVHIPERIRIGAIVTTGPGGAIALHYDPEDLLIVQTEGSKRWRIYSPPIEDPVRGMCEFTPPQGPPAFDEVLEAGDRLFLPAGYWHHCGNVSCRSTHLGVFFQPWVAWNAVMKTLAPLRFEKIFRKPLTRLEATTQVESLEAAIKRRLIDAIEALSMSELLVEMQRAEGQHAPDSRVRMSERG